MPLLLDDKRSQSRTLQNKLNTFDKTFMIWTLHYNRKTTVFFNSKTWFQKINVLIIAARFTLIFRFKANSITNKVLTLKCRQILQNHDDRYYALPRHMNNHKNSSSPRRSPRPSIYNTYSNYSSNPSNHSGHSNHSGNSHSGEQSIALSDVSVPCHCGVHVPQPLLSSV